jgi:catechol 2,3-dioxygenase-like lactoylglutathione lyase family enzyme
MSAKPNEFHLDHVAIPVTDAAATHRFYADVLGLPLVAAHEGDDWGGLPWLMMIFAVGDGRQLALIAFAGGKTANSNLPADARHYAFSVASKVRLDEWKKKLAAASVKFTEEDHGTQQSTSQIPTASRSRSPRPQARRTRRRARAPARQSPPGSNATRPTRE